VDDRAGPHSQVPPVLADLSVRPRTGYPDQLRGYRSVSLLITICGDRLQRQHEPGGRREVISQSLTAAARAMPPSPWSLPPWLRALARAASLFSARYSHPLHLHRPWVKAHVLVKGSCRGRYHIDGHPGVWLQMARVSHGSPASPARGAGHTVKYTQQASVGCRCPIGAVTARHFSVGWGDGRKESS
jgi:hypothetical protein